MVMGENTNGCVAQLLPGGVIDSAFATNGYLTVDLYPPGSDYVGDAMEMPYNRLLFGGGYTEHNMKRFSTQSNVPHISGNASVLQTTGSGTYQWFLNDTAIAGATASTYVPVVDGNYTVQVTDDLGCTYLSAIFTVTGVGIEEYYSDDVIRVYPNPVSAELFINSSEKINHIQVFDVVGKAIFYLQPQTSPVPTYSGNLKLQTSNFAQGIYFIEVISENKKGYVKFIKQ
ncbi:MAG TPA: T9SS type A sorting domain-containing protein, partial [Bacteroidia bacterium]|nr:T9SS type A sorting domain-containing protein [Bacteroidia bacterium]